MQPTGRGLLCVTLRALCAMMRRGETLSRCILSSCPPWESFHQVVCMPRKAQLRNVSLPSAIGVRERSERYCKQRNFTVNAGELIARFRPVYGLSTEQDVMRGRRCEG